MKKLLYIGALSALLTGCGETKEYPTMTEASAEKEAKKQTEQATGITIDEFEAAYIDNLTGAFTPSTREKTDDNRYTVALDQNIFLFMDVDGDNVEKSTVAAVTDSFNIQKQNIKIAFDALIKTADESLNDTQIEKLYSDLKITWDLDMLDKTKVKKFNDLKYTYQGNNEDGTVILRVELK